jgi:hypothetical protein
MTRYEMTPLRNNRDEMTRDEITRSPFDILKNLQKYRKIMNSCSTIPKNLQNYNNSQTLRKKSVIFNIKIRPS